MGDSLLGTDGHMLQLLEQSLRQTRQHGQWLENELERLRVLVEEARFHEQLLEADLAGMRTEYLPLKENIARLEGELAQAIEHKRWLQSEFSASKKRMEDLFIEFVALRAHATFGDNELAQSRQQIQWLERELATSHSHAENLQIQLTALYMSRSWRITKPMRGTHDLLRGGRRGIATLGSGFARAMKSVTKRFILTVIRSTKRYPRALEFGKRVLARFPRLNSRVRTLARQLDQPVSMEYCESFFAPVSTPAQRGEGLCIDWEQYPSSVRQIYFDLTQAVEKRNT